MLAVRLPEDIEKKLVDLAEKTGRTKTYYAREAIIEHLEDLEDYYLAVHRLENPPERTWSLEVLVEKLTRDIAAEGRTVKAVGSVVAALY